MRTGSAVSSLYVKDARNGVPATYFYAALNDSEFGFAFSLSPTDQVCYSSLLQVSFLHFINREYIDQVYTFFI